MRVVIDSAIIAEWFQGLWYNAIGWVRRVLICSRRGHDPFTDNPWAWLVGVHCKRCRTWLFFKGDGTIKTSSEGPRYKRAVITKSQTRPGGLVPVVTDPLSEPFESPLHGKEGKYAEHQP